MPSLGYKKLDASICSEEIQIKVAALQLSQNLKLFNSERNEQPNMKNVKKRPSRISNLAISYSSQVESEKHDENLDDKI